MKKYSVYSSKRQTNREKVLRIYTETDMCYGNFPVMSNFFLQLSGFLNKICTFAFKIAFLLI